MKFKNYNFFYEFENLQIWFRIITIDSFISFKYIHVTSWLHESYVTKEISVDSLLVCKQPDIELNLYLRHNITQFFLLEEKSWKVIIEII